MTETRPRQPNIDYLAKDYASFRRLMLDHLATLVPDWSERSPADQGQVLVEVLAYAADYLSYYQDAVATEAYLGTARLRRSVRRHARLLNYAMHEGCNARCWVQVRVNADDVPLPKGTQLLTNLANSSDLVAIRPDSPVYQQAIAQRPQVFEIMHDIRLHQAHNELSFFTGSPTELSLPAGTTQATLQDEWLDPQHTRRKLHQLKVGDVLIFEQVKDPKTGEPVAPGSTTSHPLRISKLTDDSAAGSPVVKIEWPVADALPFALPVSARLGGQIVSDLSLARANIVLADHGRTIRDESLPKVFGDVRYRPHLHQPGLTHGVPYDHRLAQTQSVRETMAQDPQLAMPAIFIFEDGQPWTLKRDLLDSDGRARHFIVEMEQDGWAYLRFGFRGHGRQPAAGDGFIATYRIGNGTPGNVGPGALAHIVTNDERIIQVRNYLPAMGGVDPESIEAVRHYAPVAFQTQERCVTEGDYEAIAARHPEVAKAVVRLRWTGSWQSACLYIQRRAGQPVDEAFEADLRRYMERFRLAGFDLVVRGPVYVPLDIALNVWLKPGHYARTVSEALHETLGSLRLAGGRTGYFYPGNFTFGQSVYLSQVVARAMTVPGIAHITVERFGRQDDSGFAELQAEEISLGPLEIARLDNDAQHPENGTIQFVFKGGL